MFGLALLTLKGSLLKTRIMDNYHFTRGSFIAFLFITYSDYGMFCKERNWHRFTTRRRGPMKPICVLHTIAIS